MYYYNLLDIDCFEKRDNYYFKSNNQLFSFERISNIDKSKKIFLILQKINYNKGFKIIYNIYGDMFTKISDEWYVLLLHFDEKIDILYDLLHPINLTKLFFINKRFLWNYLWSKKVDYYEYQFSHISEIYPLIFESFNYYIGLAENAISYFSYNVQDLESLDVFLCHERVSISKYYNPLNVTIDYYARDVAEYIKFLFFSGKYKNFSFFSFFENMKLNYNDYVLLFSRLLFPSYYFDIYDCIVSHKCDEFKLSEILFLADEYYLFLQRIFQVITYFSRIPVIDWIKK